MEYTLPELRAKRFLSQDSVAHDLGVSTVTYRKFERNPKIMKVSQLYQLAEIFNVETGDISLKELKK